LAGELVREPLVIVIEKGDPLSMRFMDADVAGFRGTDSYGQVEDAEARVGDGAEGVGGSGVVAVNDDEDFEIREVLAEGAADCGSDQVGAMARGDNDAHRAGEAIRSRNIACSHVTFPLKKVRTAYVREE